MAFITYKQIFDKKIEKDFGVCLVEGSSMTIPGQGCDLAQIIASIVKLPPIDERDYDLPAGEEVDTRSMMAKVDVEGLYLADGVALAKSAKERQNAKEAAKKAKADEGAKESSDEATN